MCSNPDPLRPDHEILEICLKNNCFQFNGQNYIQNNGAGMGHSYSVPYSNIYMADWEKGALLKCIILPILFKRFIDDIILFWSHGFAKFLSFFNTLDSHDPNIKLTYTYQLNSIDFLDITIYKGLQFQVSGILDTRVYFKPTDSHELLHTSSFHPKHIFSGIVKSQIIRFHRTFLTLISHVKFYLMS